METQLVKIIMRMAFETALERLQRELAHEGFEITGLTNFQQAVTMPVQVSAKKYTVLTLYHPLIYKEMICLAPFEGTILPCFITLVEAHDEETAIVPFNSTQQMLKGIHSPELIQLATDISNRIDRVIRTMEKDQHWTPDLTTSWS